MTGSHDPQTRSDPLASVPSAAGADAARFCMLCCAHGAESVVKHEIAGQGWRLAFSRPGFVTAKRDDPAPPPSGVFIRAAASSLGSFRGEHSRRLTEQIRDALAQATAGPRKFDQLHVWPRDRVPIGRFGFEPGPDEVSRAVADEVFAAIGPSSLRCDAPNRIAAPGDQVLDLVLTDPSHWFLGTHRAGDWPSRWPGGVQPIVPANPPISRAYFKAAEAITWSGFDVRPGDVAVEIGSAPGGACGRLLELGLRVIGIDPGEMAPEIAGHPRFRHVRARAGDLPRRLFRDARWMLVDANVAPEKTLTTVEHVVTHRQSRLEGLLMTLKLGDYRRAEQIPRWGSVVRRWTPERIEIRQLARNRCEICFAVRFSPRASGSTFSSSRADGGHNI